jgi:hypothetical protein
VPMTSTSPEVVDSSELSFGFRMPVTVSEQL